MSHNSTQAPARPLLWLLDKLPPLEKMLITASAVSEGRAKSRSPWPDELTREASNPLLARWALNATVAATSDAIHASLCLLDDEGLVEKGVDGNPLVIKTEQVTLIIEKSQLPIEAEWDKLASKNPWPRTVALSVHRLSPELIVTLDDAVCAALLQALHRSEERVLVAWEETEQVSDDLSEGALCEPVTPAVALALMMALTSEDAFAKVVKHAPAGVVEQVLAMTHGDATLALDWLADMLARLLVAALRPDGPRWRDEAAMAQNSTAILVHWLHRVHRGEENPTPAATGRLPQNSMVAGATVAVFMGAAARFFEESRRLKAAGDTQRTVHDAWHAFKHVVNLEWLPLPLEQRILATIATDAPGGYVILREFARTLRVPRLNAALFADWLGLVLAWLGIYGPPRASRLSHD